MKKIFTLIALLAISLSATYASNELKKDDKRKPTKGFQGLTLNEGPWFVSAGVGAQVYFGDHDKQLPFGQRITPKFEVSVGRWLNDNFALRVNVNTAKMKGLTQGGGTNGLSTGKLYRASDDLWHQEFNYINANIDVIFNMTSDIFDDPNRFYNLMPYAGFGVITVTNKQKGSNLSGNLGFLQSFKINDKFKVYLDIKGNVFRDKTDGEIGGRNFEGALSTLAGVSYSF